MNNVTQHCTTVPVCFLAFQYSAGIAAEQGKAMNLADKYVGQVVQE